VVRLVRSPNFKKPKTGVFRIEAAELELAHALGLNISDVCRTALQTAIGQKILNRQCNSGPNPDLFEEYLQVLRDRKEQEESFYKTVASTYQQKLSDVARTEAVQCDIQAAISGVVETAYKRLPEFDPHGDYTQYWQELATLVSKRVGIPVTDVTLKDYVRDARRGRA